MNDQFTDTQSLSRSLAGSVETLLVEEDLLHKFDRAILQC